LPRGKVVVIVQTKRSKGCSKAGEGTDSDIVNARTEQQRVGEGPGRHGYSQPTVMILTDHVNELTGIRYLTD